MEHITSTTLLVLDQRSSASVCILINVKNIDYRTYRLLGFVKLIHQNKYIQPEVSCSALTHYSICSDNPKYIHGLAINM